MADLPLDGDQSIFPYEEEHAFAWGEGLDGDAVRVLLRALCDGFDHDLHAGCVPHNQRSSPYWGLVDDLLCHHQEDEADGPDEDRIDALHLLEAFVARGVPPGPLGDRHADEVLHGRSHHAREVARALEEGDGGLRGAHHGGDEHPRDAATTERLSADAVGVHHALGTDDVLEVARSLEGVAEEHDALDGVGHGCSLEREGGVLRKP